MTDTPTVFLVDDDESVRDGLKWLIESVDLQVESFGSANEFLDSCPSDRPGCLVLDIRMPGISGLELQERLAAENRQIPVIVITGHGDVPMCARAFEGGAIAFLQKPVNHQELLDHIHRAIEDDRQRRSHWRQASRIEQLIGTLTSREKEVMDRLAVGKSMKQIAAELGISVQTCAKHRSRLLEKLGVDNDVELVRLLLSSNGAEAH